MPNIKQKSEHLGKSIFIGYTYRMENEKRKFFRHPLKVPIQLTRIEDQTSARSHAEDLSQGGLAFFWPEPIPEGTKLQLSIPVEKQLFKMMAYVKHAQKDIEMGLYKIGVCFEDSVSSFRAKLAEEILEIRQYREKMSLLRGQQLSEEDAAKMWIDRNAEDFAKLMASAA
jgi:c-di-GMP-binding flagellar brake protein YcgR